MRESLRLGEIAGVRLGMNWSLLVIFGLIMFGLAAGRFPLIFPDETTVAYLSAGAVAAVIFLFSLLAHELAHAIVARRNDVEVEGITLWMFGGVARLRGESRTPEADLRIAGVGPLVSLVIGGFFWTFALVLSQLGIEGLPVGVVSWLGIINVALAVFNLAPAAPLDGGRILRAWLWKRRGDRTSAAIAASRAGRVFGFLLVGLGLLTIVVTPGAGGLWPALIGWFIATAAAGEEQYARIQEALRGVEVSEVMSPDPMTVPAGTNLDDLLDNYVLRSRYSSFPVVDATGHPTGLVTLNRLKQVGRKEHPTRTVEEVACPRDELVTVQPSTPLADLLASMAGCADGRVLVVDDGRLVGIVSPTDVTRTLERAELRLTVAREHI